MSRVIIEAALRIAKEHPTVAHLVDGFVEFVTTNPPPENGDASQILADFFISYSADRCMADYRDAGITITDEIKAEIDEITHTAQLVAVNANNYLFRN